MAVWRRRSHSGSQPAQPMSWSVRWTIGIAHTTLKTRSQPQPQLDHSLRGCLDGSIPRHARERRTDAQVDGEIEYEGEQKRK